MLTPSCVDSPVAVGEESDIMIVYLNLFDSVYGTTESGPATMLEWDDNSNPGSVGSLMCNIEGKVMAVFLSDFLFKVNQTGFYLRLIAMIWFYSGLYCLLV